MISHGPLSSTPISAFSEERLLRHDYGPRLGPLPVAPGSSIGGNDQYTTLLLHMDGTDGSTTFTDSCAGATPHTVTAQGNAQIDTADSQFGGASGFFDGSGDYLSVPNSSDWDMGSGDFTIDGWFKRNGGDGTDRYIIDYGLSPSFRVSLTSGNVLSVQFTIGGVSEQITSSTGFAGSSSRTHFSTVRTGNTLKLFVNGVQEGGDNSCSGSMATPSGPLIIGRWSDGAARYWNGWLDELRISKGIARWTSNYALPTGPYDTGEGASLPRVAYQNFPKFKLSRRAA